MIESILICALFVYGVKAVIDGYALFFDLDFDYFYEFKDTYPDLHKRVVRSRPKWQQFILKPTIYCNVCMSSFWGSVYYWATSYDAEYWFIFWPIHMVCSAAIITLFNQIPE
jgi:hypothetical protein